MGKSINAVRLLGNVGRPPECKTVGNGTLRATVSLATTDRRKVDNEWKEFTEWHSVVFFGRTAEVVRDYVRKGSKIHVEGKLHTYKYEDESNTTRWRTDVVAFDLILLDGKPQGATQSAPPATESAEISDNDIPF